MEHMETELENLQDEYRRAYRRLLTEFYTSLTYRLARKYNVPKLTKAARQEVITSLAPEMRDAQILFENILEVMDEAYAKKAKKVH